MNILHKMPPGTSSLTVTALSLLFLIHFSPSPFLFAVSQPGERPQSMVDATTYADKDGRFILKARLNDTVTVIVYKADHFQSYQLQPFPATNTIDKIVWQFETNKSVLKDK